MMIRSRRMRELSKRRINPLRLRALVFLGREVAVSITVETASQKPRRCPIRESSRAEEEGKPQF